MSSAPRNAKAQRIRFGLRFKIILGLTLFNILGTALFAYSHYWNERNNIIEGVELKLAAAARALPDMLPEGYLDRAVAPDSISTAEYQAVMEKLSRYVDDVGLIYLYSYAYVDGRFHTTTSNGTPQERATGSFAAYWEPYEEDLLSEAWNTNSARYGETNDQWGHVYFLFKPAVTAAGTRYVIGADIAIAQLYAKLEDSLRRSILIGFLSFFVVFVFSFWIGTKVSRNIIRLSDYTQELAAADFKPVADLPLKQTINQIQQQSRDEISQLAGSFIAMEERLNDYLDELTETTATKERLRNELKIAGDIQLSMLPQAFKAVAPASARALVDVHATVKPAKEAGGDLYDFFFIDEDHLVIAVGDVSDKGMPAALFMTVTATVLRARASKDYIHRPEEVVRRVNEILVAQNSMCQFVTLFFGILNVRTGVLLFADGGHNHPYRRAAGGPAEMLSFAGGVALGIMGGVEYEQHRLQLQPGDTLYLYTDGVTEAVAVDESFYGEARLEAELNAIPADASAEFYVDQTLSSVFRFSEGHAQADDITILALRYFGGSA